MFSRVLRLNNKLATIVCLSLASFSITSYSAPSLDISEQSPPAAELRDGQTRQVRDSFLEAWDNVEKQWLSIEQFWHAYGARRGGLTWGSRTEYPRYSKLRELDTMVINLPSGPCLMEFFHGRWRRANNVRRWSPEFDKYGGCPHVFD